MLPDIILFFNQFFNDLEKDINQVLEVIRNLREQKNFTQEDIANKLNVARVTYTKVENGEIDLTYSRLIKICKILDVSLIQIVYGNDAEKIGLEKYNHLISELKKLLDNATNQEQKE